MLGAESVRRRSAGPGSVARRAAMTWRRCKGGRWGRWSSRWRIKNRGRSLNILGESSFSSRASAMLGALGATEGRTVRAEVASSVLLILPRLLISCCCSGQARSEGKLGQLSTDLIRAGVFIVPSSSLCVPLRP
jgi:hypothetical protein